MLHPFPPIQVVLRDPATVAAHCRDLALLPREVLVILGVDAHANLLSQQRISGQVHGVRATPRDVLPTLLRASAEALLLVHNHPSGVLRPSRADILFTQRMAEAAQICGLRLMDHVIVAGGGWLSMRDAGLLEAL